MANERQQDMKNKVIVIGAGGHAKVVIELLKAGGYQIDYCVANEGGQRFCMDVPVVFGDEHLGRLRKDGYSLVFPAIGSNMLRARLAQQVLELGFDLVNALSPSAIVSPSATIGRGVAIMAGAIIYAESRIDDLAVINTGSVVDHDCHIGYASHLAPNTALAGNVKVGELAFIGIGTSVAPEITIGKNSTIGAASAVVSDIPEGVVALGVPARVIKKKD